MLLKNKCNTHTIGMSVSKMKLKNIHQMVSNKLSWEGRSGYVLFSFSTYVLAEFISMRMQYFYTKKEINLMRSHEDNWDT